MQVFLALARVAAITAAVWFIALFLLTLGREAYPEIVVRIPYIEVIESLPPGPYLKENAFKPATTFILQNIKGKSPQEALRDILIGLLTSVLETLLKLTAIDLINLVLVGIIVPIFSLIFTRLINLNNRKLCSTHLYLVAIKAAENLALILSKANSTNQGRIIQVDFDIRTRLHRLRSELDVMSDFSIAYQHVFTRRTRRHSVAARMCLAPVREVVDLMLAEIDRPQSPGYIKLDEDQFKAVMLYRGRNVFVWIWHLIIDAVRLLRGKGRAEHPDDRGFLALVAFRVAAGSAIELNFQLAERLEGRSFFILPPAGRTLPRSVRKEHLRPIRKTWRQAKFPSIAQRLLSGRREPWWPVMGKTTKSVESLHALLPPIG